MGAITHRAEFVRRRHRRAKRKRLLLKELRKRLEGVRSRDQRVRIAEEVRAEKRD